MSFVKYKTIDLIVWGVIVCALEALSRVSLDFFPGEAFAFSVTLPVALIVIIRWGAWGVLHASLGGLTYALANGGTLENCLIYVFGNAFLAGNLLWLKRPGKSVLQKTPLYSALYVLTGYALMNLGRAIIASPLMGMTFFPLVSRYFSVEALSAVIALVAVFVARRQNGVFEDQKAYLLRVQKEVRQHA